MTLPLFRAGSRAGIKGKFDRIILRLYIGDGALFGLDVERVLLMSLACALTEN